ncbi:alpha-amylase family glycosyl hydrolase [Rhodocytophaga aerolata]|uniref:Alpha-amylase n=1 Tax=Rhodocytophaga aerolata TaxID=455078 RepID=A0ABT8R965_9BACT|nr:alpha-amylase family glycosyl hydrolase [Rhodocytophaga aerolata]MDO1448634.1 alpha-amylase family glycosyl hydrolase [Rhodocytophaga aerolata]
MSHKLILPVLFALALTQCTESAKQKSEDTIQSVAKEKPFSWRNATVYFLLTDRFNNGNPKNDVNFNRTSKAANLRGFEGGDIAGVTQKIKDGYFDKLGITALWLTPLVEQIHGKTDEGTGATYGYHGYWAKDWTSLDPNFGTEQELLELVNVAHEHGIRVLFDVVINHTGPVTDKDPAWPDSWVRQSPVCSYKDYQTTVECTLVKNLPDIHTESNQPVELPESLKQKWQQEGRLEKEIKELDEFFSKTNYPRAPRFYIIKWLTDLVRKYGIDGFRVDTAKHTEASIWAELEKEAQKAFDDWKANNPGNKLDDTDFFMVAEVYGFSAGAGRAYDYGDKKVDFYDNGFESMINFAFKYDAKGVYDSLFTKYDTVLHGGSLEGLNVLNYLASHDDGDPFDKQRQKPLESGTKLLLAGGAAQVYYGDEIARPLVIPGAEGDANLRSVMNWEALEKDSLAKATFDHWSKLGRFRKEHIAIGDGKHTKLQDTPYTFSRTYAQNGYQDQVVVALDAPAGNKSISVGNVFQNGAKLIEYYSGKPVEVKNGKVELTTPYTTVLLAAEEKVSL